MAALLKLVPVSQITYGTDYPYFLLNQNKELQKLGLSAADVQAIEARQRGAAHSYTQSRLNREERSCSSGRVAACRPAAHAASSLWPRSGIEPPPVRRRRGCRRRRGHELCAEGVRAGQAAPHRRPSHIVPPTWFAAMEVIGRDDFPLKNWSIAKMIEDMDKGGVATSMTSPTTPQVTPLGKDVAVRIARESNEYAKKMMADHPGRFGVWATLPLPHIDESLKEIAYAFDTLKVDGIGCMTSYGDKWLGHPMFAPVWEELNRRKATVYTHPTVGQLLRQSGAGRARLRDRVRHRHDAHDREPDPQRHVAEVQGHQLDLVARRRRADRLRRALPVAAREHAAVPRQDHAASR